MRESVALLLLFGVAVCNAMAEPIPGIVQQLISDHCVQCHSGR